MSSVQGRIQISVSGITGPMGGAILRKPHLSQDVNYPLAWRPPSVSATGSVAPSSGPATPADLASLYECPVCFEYISPPILQCKNGHMVCSICRPKLNCCPSCKAALGTSRNLALETALSNIEFPCKFSAEGCKVTMLLTDKVAHEKSCVLRPCCPCPYCNWQGAMDQVVPHILSKHPTIEQGDHFIYPFGTHSLSQSGDGSQWAKLLHCHDQHFLFIFKKESKLSNKNGRFLAAVHLIGTRNAANNFSYRFQLSGLRHKIIWEAKALSILEDLHSASNRNECLIIENMDGVQLFSQNSQLDFDVKVVKYPTLISSWGSANGRTRLFNGWLHFFFLAIFFFFFWSGIGILVSKIIFSK